MRGGTSGSGERLASRKVQVGSSKLISLKRKIANLRERWFGGPE